MHQKRIALIDLTPIRHDLVARIVVAAGHEVVDNVDEAHVAILRVEPPVLRERHLDLLERRPRIKLLGLVDDGRDCVLWELRPHHELIGDVSPQTLLDAIARPDWRSHVAFSR